MSECESTDLKSLILRSCNLDKRTCAVHNRDVIENNRAIRNRWAGRPRTNHAGLALEGYSLAEIQCRSPVSRSRRDDYGVAVLGCLHGVIDVLVCDAGGVNGCGAGR